jgi:hypothetical protein
VHFFGEKREEAARVVVGPEEVKLGRGGGGRERPQPGVAALLEDEDSRCGFNLQAYWNLAGPAGLERDTLQNHWFFGWVKRGVCACGVSASFPQLYRRARMYQH